MKRYILQKFVFAESVVEAIRKDKESTVENVILDNDFKSEEKPSLMGFRTDDEYFPHPYLTKKRNAKSKKKTHK